MIKYGQFTDKACVDVFSAQRNSTYKPIIHKDVQ